MTTKGPCPSCGSSDACVTYDDGHQHCFSMGCSHHTGGQDMTPFTPAAPARTDLLQYEVSAFPKRGIDEDTAQKWRVGHTEFRGEKAQVYPYFDRHGRMVAQKVRRAGKRFEVVGDLKSAGLFGENLWRSGGKMVVLVEGEIDALSVSQIQANRWPVASIPTGAQGAKKAIAASLEWLETFDRVIFMFDMDEPGRAAAEECAAVLTPGKAFIASLPAPFKDANDALKAGEGKAVIDAMWGAKPWRPDGIVSGPTVWQRVLARDNAAFAPVPHAGLNEKWMGLRPGEISVLVAGTGSGKSTTCREWATALAKAGHKIGYIGLEEPIEMTAMGLASVCVSRPLHLLPREELSKPDVLEAAAMLEERVVYYDHHGVKADTDLLAKMKFMAQAEKCRLIVFDHLSIVISGGDLKDDERRTIDRMLMQLASFGQQTGVHVLAVCHLSRREGKPHEEGRPVTLADLRGSHGISQLAFNVASIERNQQAATEAARDTSIVRSLKCRWAGRTGIAGYVRYVPETGRQIEVASMDTDSPFDDAGSDEVG